MPRFAVLRHDYPFLHWDFLLEAGESLRAWRLRSEPQAGESIDAEPLPDHRRMYLDYEGPVSGNRGEVTRFDAGEYTMLAESETETAVVLAGAKLRGTAWLTQAAGRWTFYLRRG